MRRASILTLLMILVGVGCSPTDTSTTSSEVTVSTSPTPPTTTPLATTQPPATTSTTSPSTSTTAGVTTTTLPEIDVFVEGGQVIGPDRFDYPLGDEVSIWLLTDVADEVHVHGYDLFFLAKPGVPVEIILTADIPGIFEVELESDHLLLFELQVTP